MILEFSVTNFRSIKDKTTLSLVAESSKSKSDNVFIHSFPYDDSVRLLKSAVIYGPNGSGKSNIIRAFYYLLALINDSRIKSSFRSKAGDKIWQYDPFLFDEKINGLPVIFELVFIGPDEFKYRYVIEFNAVEITLEQLSYFPNGKEAILFKRPTSIDQKNLIHKGKLGNVFNNKEVSVFHNKLLLSKFGEDEPNDMLTNLYVYLNKYDALNTHNKEHAEKFELLVDELFIEDEKFQKQLNDLIRRSDVKINSISTNNNANSFEVFGQHDLYDADNKIGEKALQFQHESTGTNTLYILGGSMLNTLNKGGVLFVDELETSLHPNLSKMLVELFQSSKSNPNNAQLIFTTHDVTLLSKSIFRKDQIWITQKDKFGKTDLYSVQDFKEAREDTPFDRWYIAGRFGGLPFIEGDE